MGREALQQQQCGRIKGSGDQRDDLNRRIEVLDMHLRQRVDHGRDVLLQQTQAEDLQNHPGASRAEEMKYLSGHRPTRGSRERRYWSRFLIESHPCSHIVISCL